MSSRSAAVSLLLFLSLRSVCSSFVLRQATKYHRLSFRTRLTDMMNAEKERNSDIKGDTEELADTVATTNGDQESCDAKKPRSLFHHYSVCMVPPELDEGSNRIWIELSKLREELRDPGLFRWPPHANLLYPFVSPVLARSAKPIGQDAPSSVDINNADDNGDEVPDRIDWTVLSALREACARCEPFRVRLEQLGTFGGAKRGVLWLYPDSYRVNGREDLSKKQPLIQLYDSLIESFPECRKGGASFHPHMTLSHFSTLQEAAAAQKRLEDERDWLVQESMLQGKHTSDSLHNDNGDKNAETHHHRNDGHFLDFEVKEIYLLVRKGDDGQFARLATIPIGRNATTQAVVHQPQLPFRYMPTKEAKWVREERMALKARRKRQGTRRRSRSPKQSDSNSRRSVSG